MDQITELLVNFINTRIEQSMQDFKKQISGIPMPEQSVSAEEIQRFMDVLQQRSEGGGDLMGALDRLGQVEEEWASITDQVRLIESFLKIADDYCDYNGFFVFKNGSTLCYDATDHDRFPQKGVTVETGRFDQVLLIQDSDLPADIKNQFSGIDDTYVLPLKLKFKVAGFVITVLSEPQMLSFMKSLVAMMSRELTLLPYKMKARSESTARPTTSEPEPSRPSKTPSISSVASESPMDKAMRYAKLLASEIKLYNESVVNEALQTGGMKEKLSADIERSYHTFRERFPNREEIPDRIFDEALIAYLANGDADLL